MTTTVFRSRIVSGPWLAVAVVLHQLYFSGLEALAQDQPPESLTGPGGGGPSLPFGFDANISDNLYFAYMTAVFLLFFAMAHGNYMALALGKIRQRVHPSTLQWTVYAFWLGLFFIFVFILLRHAELGVFVVICAVYLAVILGLIFASRLILSWILGVVGLAVLVGAARYMGLI